MELGSALGSSEPREANMIRFKFAAAGASGERIVAAANGSNFAASLSLTTHGNRQSVAIQPQGTDVSEVSIALNKQ
jgi:hypothetical protein